MGKASIYEVSKVTSNKVVKRTEGSIKSGSVVDKKKAWSER